MAKIKHTKTELKAQKVALEQFEHFLPMLQLKKQQLQVEIEHINAFIAEREAESRRQWEALEAWVSLFSEPVDVEGLVTLQAVRTEQGNIAGVAIPLFKEVEVEPVELDLFDSPSWMDDAIDAVSSLIELRAETEVLKEQRERIEAELRTTSQRVNLFEKVKIPECREHIRVIKIHLGDEQTAAVARGKLAKKRTESVLDS